MLNTIKGIILRTLLAIVLLFGGVLLLGTGLANWMDNNRESVDRIIAHGKEAGRQIDECKKLPLKDQPLFGCGK